MTVSRRGLLTSGAVLVASVAHASGTAPQWTTGRLAVPGGEIVWRTYGKGRGLPLITVTGGPTPMGSKLVEVDWQLAPRPVRGRA